MDNLIGVHTTPKQISLALLDLARLIEGNPALEARYEEILNLLVVYEPEPGDVLVIQGSSPAHLTIDLKTHKGTRIGVF